MSLTETFPTWKTPAGTVFHMTLDEYLKLPEDVRAEWVDGKVEIMAPVNVDHGRIVMFLASLIREYAATHELGEVAGEPAGIHLASQMSVRMPDVFFVSNSRLDRISKMLVQGAPDLAIEVVSPGGQKRDRKDKFGEYEQAGVLEYWIVDPTARSLDVFTLGEDRKFRGGPVDSQHDSIVLPGLYIRPEWLWVAKPMPVYPLISNMRPPK